MPDAVSPHCMPHTVSYFHVERQLRAPGVCADIRHFGWQQPSRDAVFETDAHYIDFSIGPRNRSASLVNPNGGSAHRPGDLVFIPRGRAFMGDCDPSEHSLLCLTLEGDRAIDLFEDDGLPELGPCFDVQAGRVRSAMARLVRELRSPGFGQDILLESMALTIVVDLCRHLRGRSDGAADDRGRMPAWRVRRIKERIDSELSGSLSIAELAADIRTSPRHLVRTFKATTGMTLTDYIARQRISHAMEMLRSGDGMIKVVAAACGFQSPAAFSAAFRKATGVTPREFREGRERLQ